jgi:uncharacterized protein
VIICDSNALLAAANDKDTNYRICTEELTRLRLRGEQLLVPALVVAEVGYLLETKVNSRVEAAFLDSVAEGDFICVTPNETDFRRMAHLVRQYEDLGLGTTDACVIATAERLGIREIVTLDRRHFPVVRPERVPAFTLLPEDYVPPK